MSSASTPAPSPSPSPTQSFDPGPFQPTWAPPNRRFAIRVQRALDAGRLDPALVQEIRNLPSGALYFSPSSKSKKVKIRPVMYEVYLGDPESKSFSGNGGNDGTTKVGEVIDWEKITPVAVSKLITNADDPVQTTPSESEPTPGRTTSRFHFISSVISSSRTEPTTQRETSANPVPPPTQTPMPPTTPPSDPLALSVFIAMPSPISRLSRAKIDGEEVVPDVCLGVTRVDMIG